MSERAMILLVLIVAGILVSLFFFSIFLKLQMTLKTRRNAAKKIIINKEINTFINGSEREFSIGLEKFAKETRWRSKKYMLLVDDYLQDSLDNPEPEYREKFVAIAHTLNFSQDCIDQIRSRNPKISALGARRAGLYRFPETVNDLIDALDILSSENQFEVLLALSRIGKGDAMAKAFTKIKNNVFINERAAIQLLSSFPNGNEKRKLFAYMIHSRTSYVAALFLKSLDKETAKALVNDMVDVLYHEDKGVRTAAMRGITTLGAEAPEKELIKALLQDNEWEVRNLAAKALGPIKTSGASKALFMALSDRQWWVRQNAASSLIGHPGSDDLFILAAETGDKYCMDSIVSALENAGKSKLANSIKKLKEY
ncbi:MAG: HEAT repeat domain-containing protein [Treponema sp.]|jgi:hypothetical protein|nr:HEAT repeat domain-containing protein [Treponema sp.]